MSNSKSHPNNCTCGCKHTDLLQDSSTQIILYKVESKNKYYGTLYYDKILDRLCFSNKNNKIINLTDKRSTIEFNTNKDRIMPFMGGMDGKDGDIGPIGPKGPQGDSFIFKDIWQPSIQYFHNDLVKDSDDYENIYICIKDIESTKSPSKDSENWKFFFGNSINFRGHWKGKTQYNINSVVIDNITKNVYICIKTISDNIPPHQNKSFVPFLNIKALFGNKVQELHNMKNDLEKMIKDMSDINDIESSSNFKNEWMKGQTYLKNDIVVDSTDNKLYVCKNDITSDKNPSESILNWKMMEEIYYKGEWNSIYDYDINSSITYGSRLYISTGFIEKNTEKPSLNKTWKRLDNGDVASIGLRYRKYWKTNTEYKYNDLVKDISNENIYIFIGNKSIKSDIHPFKDSENWTFFSGNGFNFDGEWNIDKQYYINNAVIDPKNTGLYIATKSIKDDILPSESNNWKLLLSLNNYGMNGQSINNTLFAFATNGNCCLSYNIDKGLSSFNFENCSNNHIQSNTDVYNYIMFNVEKTCIYPLVFNYINKSNKKYFNFNETPPAIYITSSGFYKITCNIAYYGSIYDFICSVSVVNSSDNNRKPEEIMFSKNKSINRPYNDSRPDKYYETPEDPDTVFQCINYTFPFSMKEDNTAYLLLMLLKFGSHNSGKKIFIKPVNTWMCIERIGD